LKTDADSQGNSGSGIGIFKPVSKINLPPQQNPAKPRDDLPLDWSSSATFLTSGTPSLYISCKNLHYEEENCILSS
jgi:hypothetical protein